MGAAEKRAILQRIEQAISAARLSRNQLARDLGVPHSTFYSWLNGQGSPPLDVWADMCRRLGRSSDELLGLKDLKPVEPGPDPKVQALLRAVDQLTTAARDVEAAAVRRRQK